MVNGWIERPLGELGVFSKGSGVSRTDSNSGKLPCVRYGEIYTHHNNYIKEFKSFISPKVAQTATLLKKGDLLFTGSGETKEEIGKCVAFVYDYEAYAGGDIIILSPYSDVDPMFMGFMLNTPNVSKQKASKGQGDAVVHITAKSLADISVNLPPLPEQRTIAAALSDTDTYITALEKLITKKRAIKHGAMQELLTGKRRLRGFDGEWISKPLLDCCELLQGLTYSPNNVKSYGLLVLRSSNIKNRKLSFDDCVYVNCNVDENKYVKTGDILICVRNGSSALIGKSCVIDKDYKATFGAFMSILRGDDTGYIAHIFTSDVVQGQIRNRSSATINQITKRDFEDIVIPTPPTLAEQTAIASILSDMDSEIDVLTAKLEKARRIKHGMMNELLTGRIQLIEEDTDNGEN